MPTKCRLFLSVIYYEPALRWFDSNGDEIADASSVSLKTGEYMKVTVRAYMPNGQVDSGFTSTGWRNWLLPNSTGDAANIQYYNVDDLGQPLSTIDSVKLENGESTFFIKSDEPVNGDAFTFRYTYSSYVSSLKPQGSAIFPVDVQISYGDAPMLESAAIYDRDGDGMGDEIRGWFDMSVDSKPTSPLTSWPVDTAFVPVSTKTITMAWTSGADSITVNTDEKNLPAGILGEGDFRVTVTGESGNQVVTTAALKDRIGPVLQSVTLIPGRNGDPDTLVARFNKEIDLFNGQPFEVVTARQPGRRIVLLESMDLDITGKDYVQLHELASFLNLPFIVEEEYSRQVPVTVIDRLPALASAGEYYDSNGDGVMDSVVFVFSSAITEEQKAMLNFTIPWQSYRGRTIQLMPDPSAWVIDPQDPTRISWVVQSNVDLRDDLTQPPSSLPNAELFIEYPVFAEEFVEHRILTMQDKMAPVIVEAKITYASSADTLLLRFSEPVDADQMTRKDIFLLVHGNDTLVLEPQSLDWSSDGLSVKIALWTGDSKPVTPGDLIIVRGDAPEGAILLDQQGNGPLSNQKPVLIEGSLKHLVASSNFGRLSQARMDSTARLSSMSVNWVNPGVRTDDLQKQGRVGQMVELGQRFLPQLVDRANVSVDSLNPEDVSVIVSTYYFDNLVQYVTDMLFELPCNHPTYFDGNCLQTNKKLFIDWNYQDNTGRFVGTGVYVANFHLFVRYKNVSIEEQRLEEIGVKRTK